jgi:hypothetical protein
MGNMDHRADRLMTEWFMRQRSGLILRHLATLDAERGISFDAIAMMKSVNENIDIDRVATEKSNGEALQELFDSMMGMVDDHNLSVGTWHRWMLPRLLFQLAHKYALAMRGTGGCAAFAEALSMMLALLPVLDIRGHNSPGLRIHLQGKILDYSGGCANLVKSEAELRREIARYTAILDQRTVFRWAKPPHLRLQGE